MSILKDVSPDIRQRLLELYPVAHLRSEFGKPALLKDGIAKVVAASNKPADIGKISLFADKYLGCCKQHVYVFSKDLAIPASVKDGELVRSAPTSSLFMARLRYDVFTENASGKSSVEFLWPIRVELAHKCLIVRFVVMEKSMVAIFGDTAKVLGKSLTEEAILATWGFGAPDRIDLNKGIKSLWHADWIECTKGQYRKAYGVSSENMNEGLGIKKQYPDIYAQMQQEPILLSSFKVSDEKLKLHQFNSNPTEGIIGFQTYNPQLGDSDAVIRKIIESNN